MKNIKTISPLLNITLWAAQGLLAVLLLYAAAMKLFAPVDKLAAMWPWTASSRKLVFLTGILDALAGCGLILPLLTGIAPQLTFYAAIGLIALMFAAIVFHISRGEAAQVWPNIIVIILAGFVAWGRG